MNEPQMKLPGFLTVRALVAAVAAISHFDHLNKEIDRLKITCTEAR